MPHGKGTYKFLSESPNKGNIYEGEFKNSLLEGRGVYKWASGNICEVEFKIYLFKPRVCYKYVSGNAYEYSFTNKFIKRQILINPLSKFWQRIVYWKILTKQSLKRVAFYILAYKQ